jgi:predicted nucleic acid-binding protein
MKWLLDTNVVSESVRDQPSPDVLNWLAARSPDLIAVSLVTVAELQEGAQSTSNPTRRKRLQQWLEREFPTLFADRILPVTGEILVDWLALARRLAVRGMTRPAPDLLIAATARVHDLILVTRNTRDFAGTGVIVYDPWTGKTHHMEDK